MKNNNLYPVFAYGKWGAVDRAGNQAIPMIYTYGRTMVDQLSGGGVLSVLSVTINVECWI